MPRFFVATLQQFEHVFDVTMAKRGSPGVEEHLRCELQGNLTGFLLTFRRYKVDIHLPLRQTYFNEQFEYGFLVCIYNQFGQFTFVLEMGVGV